MLFFGEGTLDIYREKILLYYLYSKARLNSHVCVSHCSPNGLHKHVGFSFGPEYNIFLEVPI